MGRYYFKIYLAGTYLEEWVAKMKSLMWSLIKLKLLLLVIFVTTLAQWLKAFPRAVVCHWTHHHLQSQALFKIRWVIPWKWWHTWRRHKLSKTKYWMQPVWRIVSVSMSKNRSHCMHFLTSGWSNVLRWDKFNAIACNRCGQLEWQRVLLWLDKPFEVLLVTQIPAFFKLCFYLIFIW